VISAFVLIKARPDRIAALASELADVDGVAEVYSVAGDVDVVAVVRVHEHDQLADVVTRHIAALDGILETRSMVAYRAYSKHDLESMFSLGTD
jgi:DNA-binding Lrp family transcriptional regulator